MVDPFDTHPSNSPKRDRPDDDCTSESGPTLPERFQNFVCRTADSLAEAYRVADSASNNEQSHTTEFDDPWDFYESEKEHLLTHRHINYWLEGTGRVVAVVGKTFDGDLVFEGRRGVVIKFQPWLSLEAEKFQERRSNAMNLREIRVWEEAVQREDTDLFASIFDHSKSGHWIAMEQCLPIYPSGPPPQAPTHDHISDTLDKDLIAGFRDRFNDRGWYEHDLKHGNVGRDADGKTVLLDYGSYAEFTG